LFSRGSQNSAVLRTAAKPFFRIDPICQLTYHQRMEANKHSEEFWKGSTAA